MMKMGMTLLRRLGSCSRKLRERSKYRSDCSPCYDPALCGGTPKLLFRLVDSELALWLLHFLGRSRDVKLFPLY